MKFVRTPFLIATLALVACRDKSSPVSAPPVAAPPPKSAPTVPAVAPAATAGSTENPKPAKDENPDLTALNAAYRRFWQETQSPPANLDILVKRGYLKTMPVPPKGKKFVLNWEKMEVTLAPQ